MQHFIKKLLVLSVLTGFSSAIALFPNAHWGMYVIDAETKEVLSSYQADQLYIPASITKLFTAASALQTLGSKHVFHTTVRASKLADKKGHVHGNLYLEGGADPSLKCEDLKALAKRVQEAGIKVIHGNVIVDDRLFKGSPLPRHGEWEDLREAYAVEAPPLSVNENVIHVTVTPGHKANRYCRIQTDEQIPYCRIVNQVQTVAQGVAKISFERGLTNNELKITGAIPLKNENVTTAIAIHKPEEYARRIFVKALKDLKISVKEKSYSAKPDKSFEIARHTSAPLATLIKRMNKISDNLYAELIYRYMNATGEKGPFDQLMKRLKQKPQDYVLYDGSGLSRHNLISPKQVVKLLEEAFQSPYSQEFIDSLPIGGVDGSLKDRFANCPSYAVIKAKTGGMTGISNLAGLIELSEGRKFIFAIFVNNSMQSWMETSAAIDELLIDFIARFAS